MVGLNIKILQSHNNANHGFHSYCFLSEYLILWCSIRWFLIPLPIIFVSAIMDWLIVVQWRIWHHKAGSILAQIIVCYLIQCWLHWLGSEAFTRNNFTESAQATILYNELKIFTFAIIGTSPKGQWVNTSRPRQMATILQTTFSKVFLEWKLMNFD